MQVKDVMQKNILSVQKGTTLSQLLDIFSNFHSFPVIPVVDKQGILVGLVHIRSFFEVFEPQNQELLMRNPLSMVGREPANIFDIEIDEGMGFLVIAADIMDHKVVKIDQEKDLHAAYDLMQLHKRHAIPAVDSQGKLVGIVSMFEIVMQIFKEKGLV
jgi:CBS domain-containing protein